MRKFSIPHTNLFNEIHNGNIRWVVYLGRRFTRAQPIKKRFRGYKEAKKWLLDEVERRKDQGASGYLLTPAQQEMAARALAVLDGRATLTQAVEDYVKRKFPGSGTCTTSKAVAAWLEAKKFKSTAYLERVKGIYADLAEAFPGEVHTITSTVLGKWLDGRRKRNGELISNNSWNHYRDDLAALFNWCAGMVKGRQTRNRRWMGHNPASELEERDQSTPDIGILTPQEALNLLRAAHKQPGCPLLGFFVIALYTGIRTGEISRLDWSDVRLDDEPQVLVKSSKAKDKEARGVPLPSNAVAWLKEIPFRTGRVAPEGVRTKAHYLRIKSVPNYPRNAGRHSYVSYRAKIAGEAVASEEAGHESVGITRKRYKAFATRRTAEAYFSLLPSTTDEQLAAKLATPVVEKMLESAVV
jgi:integrase